MRCFVLCLLIPGWALSAPLGLVDALNLARSTHERAALAEVAVRRARANVEVAWAAVYPRVALGATGQLNDRSIERQGRTTQPLALAGTQLVVDARLFEGRALPGVDRAEALATAAALQSRFDIETLAFTVADAWYAAWVATRLREAAERTVNTAAENLEVVRTRREVGKALGVDEAQAQLRAVQASEVLTRATALEASTLDLLGVLVGQEGPLELGEPPPVAAEVQPDVPTATTRLDVRALEATARAAQVLVDAAWMEFLPSVGLRGTAGITTAEAADGEHYAGALLLTLEWVIFDAGRRARHEQQAVEVVDTQLRAAQRTREARFWVRQARRDVATLTATGSTAEQALQLARESRTQVLARYRAGRATAFELVEAEDALRQAELDRVARTLELYRARLALFEALGLDPLGQEIPTP